MDATGAPQARERDMVTYREHVAAMDGLGKRMAALELEQTQQRAQLAHLPADVRDLTKAVQDMAARLSSTPAPDNNTLALHNVADSLRKAVEEMAKRPQQTSVADLLELARAQPRGSVLDTMVKIAAGGLLAWTLFQGLT